MLLLVPSWFVTNIIEAVKGKDSHMHICGDFNYKEIDWLFLIEGVLWYRSKYPFLMAKVQPRPEHTPFPSPERAIYGFVLYLGCFICIVLYLGWAFIPDSWLHSVGLTYYPQKYWAVALPAYVIVIVLLGYFTYFAAVFINTPSFSSLNTITDKYALSKSDKDIPENAIPHLYDIPVSEVTRKYYLNQWQSN